MFSFLFRQPNDSKRAFEWEVQKVVQQLRACGVLETVRISAAGFPSRWTYENFYGRYFLLCRLSQTSDDERHSGMQIVRNHIDDEDKYRFGLTQIFFRAGQVARLEEIRTNLRRKYIITVQSLARSFCARRRFVRFRAAVIRLQSYARGYLVRKRIEAERRERAAVVIQKCFRGWRHRHRFQSIKRAALLLQARGRGLLTRRRFKDAVVNHRVTQLQRVCRGYLARKAFAEKRRKIVLCQSAIRRFLARRQFKRLKAEARSINHVQKKYKGLENKIILMQQKMDQLNKENAELKEENSSIPDMKRQLQEKKALDMNNRALKERVQNVEVQLNTVHTELDRERDEKMSLLGEKVALEEALKGKVDDLESENERLKAELVESKENISKFEAESTKRKRMLSESESNELHQAYQRAVNDKEFLESENFVLKEEINRLIKSVPLLSPIVQSRSINNFSSMDEDFGYSSGRNTLELKKGNSKKEQSSSPDFGSTLNFSRHFLK